MKKFQLVDNDVTQQLYNYLKSLDKFNVLDIQVEERYLATIWVSVAFEDEVLTELKLPHRDGIVGVPNCFEDQILYLSWQIIYFRDVEILLDSPLLVKSYKPNTSDYALGETVLNGVKYEFSLSAGNESTQPDFHIDVKFTQVDDCFQVDSQVKTKEWYSYSKLDEIFYRLKDFLKGF